MGRILPQSVALNQTRSVVQYFGCPQNNQWLDCLRRVDANALNSYPNLTANLIYGTEILPNIAQNAFKLGQYVHGI